MDFGWLHIARIERLSYLVAPSETKTRSCSKRYNFIIEKGNTMKSKLSLPAVLMWVCLGAIVIMCFYPPWVAINSESGERVSLGYYFVSHHPVYAIHSTPVDLGHWEDRINFERLASQCVPLLGIAVLLYLIQVNDRKKQKE